MYLPFSALEAPAEAEAPVATQSARLLQHPNTQLLHEPRHQGHCCAAVVGDCWLEPNVLNIKELESDITAFSKVTAEDLVILAFLKENGVVSALKENGVLEGDAKVRPRRCPAC